MKKARRHQGSVATRNTNPSWLALFSASWINAPLIRYSREIGLCFVELCFPVGRPAKSDGCLCF